MRYLIAAFCGFLMASGIIMAGMSDPQVVLGFLTINSHWDPSLAWVMASALLVFASVYFGYRRRRGAPVFASEFKLSAHRKPNVEMIVGASVFGIGWGIVGLCPGPALINITTLNTQVFTFLLAMTAGLWLSTLYKRGISR